MYLKLKGLWLTTFIAWIFLGEHAWAWGPATHFYYSLTVLSRLNDLVEPVRQLLSIHSMVYLYGSVSADIVLAKKLGKAATHCHNWETGMKLYQTAHTDRLKAFALGYLSHLAADTVSHNCYVPSKTVKNFDKGVLKHMYWELRFDKKVVTPHILTLFSKVANGDYKDCDEHFETVIPVRILDFSFNKKIFKGVLLLQQLKYWQKMLRKISRSERMLLTDAEVEDFSERSMHAIMNFLNNPGSSHAELSDPIGEDKLRLAHKVRRKFLYQSKLNKAPTKEQVDHIVTRLERAPEKPLRYEDLFLKPRSS